MLEVSDVTFSYSDRPVLENISFSISKGTHVAIIGESGCGKSTLLKLLYGLHDVDSGSISNNGNPILGPKFHLIPGENYIKYLAQDFGLMPFTTVAENVGQFLSNVDKVAKKRRVSELLELVDMQDFANVKPKNLSGGQQQRVALAKVLALEPEVLLLDEPFSQIDAFRTNTLRRNIFSFLKRHEITCLVATHDAIDMLAFSDETIVIQNGKIIRKGAVEDVFKNPASKYTASLFGDVNEIPESIFKSMGDSGKKLLVYPHELEIVASSRLMATVKNSYFMGSFYHIEAQSDVSLLYFHSEKKLPFGRTVFLGLKKFH